MLPQKFNLKNTDEHTTTTSEPSHKNLANSLHRVFHLENFKYYGRKLRLSLLFVFSIFSDKSKTSNYIFEIQYRGNGGTFY